MQVYGIEINKTPNKIMNHLQPNKIQLGQRANGRLDLLQPKSLSPKSPKNAETASAYDKFLQDESIQRKQHNQIHIKDFSLLGKAAQKDMPFKKEYIKNENISSGKERFNDIQNDQNMLIQENYKQSLDFASSNHS